MMPKTHMDCLVIIAYANGCVDDHNYIVDVVTDLSESISIADRVWEDRDKLYGVAVYWNYNHEVKGTKHCFHKLAYYRESLSFGQGSGLCPVDAGDEKKWQICREKYMHAPNKGDPFNDPTVIEDSDGYR